MAPGETPPDPPPDRPAGRVAAVRARIARESAPRSAPGDTVVNSSDGGRASASTRRPPRPLGERPLVRAGAFAWAILGLLALVFVVARSVAGIGLVTVPLALALFPAAVLAPPTQRLKRANVPDAAASLAVLLSAVGLLVLLFSLLAPAVRAELGGLADRLQEGYDQVQAVLASGPLGLDPIRLDTLIERLRGQFTQQVTQEGNGEIGSQVVEAGVVLVEGFTGLILLLLALFFYLKDGPRLAAWVRDLFPASLRQDVQSIGDRVWFTIGRYIRGLLIIGLVDAIAIGAGLALLRIPLAMPLAVLVFFGALFPIVGAFTAGTVAVLVALATNGVASALAVLVLILVVQQVEGHLLTPLLLGRATHLHPLAVIAALTVGGVLLGVLGAFLAVPVAASVTRAVGYLRERSEPGLAA